MDGGFFHDIFLAAYSQTRGVMCFGYIGHAYKFPLLTTASKPSNFPPDEQPRDPGVREGPIIDNLPLYGFHGIYREETDRWYCDISHLGPTKDYPISERHSTRNTMYKIVLGDREKDAPPIRLNPRGYDRPAMRPRLEDRTKFANGGDYYLLGYGIYRRCLWRGALYLEPSAWLTYDYAYDRYRLMREYFGKDEPVKCLLIDVVSNKIVISEEHRNREDKSLPQCYVCLESFEPDQTVQQMKTSCGHLFHRDCIGQWLSNGDNCPTCRSSIRQFLNDTNRSIDENLDLDLPTCSQYIAM